MSTYSGAVKRTVVRASQTFYSGGFGGGNVNSFHYEVPANTIARIKACWVTGNVTANVSFAFEIRRFDPVTSAWYALTSFGAAGSIGGLGGPRVQSSQDFDELHDLLPGDRIYFTNYNVSNGGTFIAVLTKSEEVSEF